MEAKTMVGKKKTTQELSIETEPVAVEETDLARDLRTTLEEIAKYEGVIGYILRNSTSAAIDLKDPTKIIDYAILSSSLFDAGEEMSTLLNIGDIKNIIIEGKDAKIISLTVNENKISVFMEKNANSEKILKKLHSF